MGDDAACVKEVRRVGQDAVVTLAGAVDLHHTTQVHRALVSACEAQPRRLVIDLTAVTYLDSSGIGTLVEVFRRVSAYRGQMILCGLAERVRGVFEITRLDKFFTIVETQSQALA